MATAEKKTAKHTPGPWTDPRIYHNPANGKPERIVIYASIPSGITHESVIVHEVRPVHRVDEHLANARLIAAAPGLLAACRLALEAIKDAHHGISTDDREATIEQAIANAEDRD